MKQTRNILFSFFALLTSLAQALTPNHSHPAVSSPEADRLCVMQFSSNGMVDHLSGFLWNQKAIISVGHSSYYNVGNAQSRCHQHASDIKTWKRHPLYDFNYQPKSTADWARYDVAVFPLMNTVKSDVKPIEILSDANQIQQLIQQGKCTISGGGVSNFQVSTILSPGISATVTAPDHVVLEYTGSAVVGPGDSGGPLLCQKDNQTVLAGFLEYAGAVQRPTSTANIVGILVLRPELAQWIEKQAAQLL